VTTALDSLRTPTSVYEVALVAHLLKGTDTAASILRLAEYGHGEIALGAMRISFEVLISAYWMNRDPDTRASKYERFAASKDYDTLVLLRSRGLKLRVAKPELERVIAHKKTVAKEFERRSLGWTQTALRRRLDEIAKPHKGKPAIKGLHQYARIVDVLGNRSLHVGTRDAVQRLTEQPFGGYLGPHPLTEIWSAIALQTAAWSYGWLVYLLAHEMSLCDAKEWIESLRTSLVECAKAHQALVKCGNAVAPLVARAQRGACQRK